MKIRSSWTSFIDHRYLIIFHEKKGSRDSLIFLPPPPPPPPFRWFMNVANDKDIFVLNVHHDEKKEHLLAKIICWCMYHNVYIIELLIGCYVHSLWDRIDIKRKINTIYCVTPIIHSMFMIVRHILSRHSQLLCELWTFTKIKLWLWYLWNSW